MEKQRHQEKVRAALGTIAHNRQFSPSDLSDYIGRDARGDLRKLVADGLVERVGRGEYFPTTKGWAWIEGGGRSASDRKLPRNQDVMVWDNGGETYDRYYVAIRNYDGRPGWDFFGMSRTPFVPPGDNNQYFTTLTAFNPSPFWGKRVTLNSLPPVVRKAIKLRQSDAFRHED